MCRNQQEMVARRSSLLLGSAFVSSVQQTERIILPGKPGENDEIFHITRGKIPAELKPLLSQPFTEQEKERIYSQVGLTRAEHVPESARPKALWIFGPPAAGKSTLAAEAAAERFGQAMNAVSVDGNEIRDAHDGFRRVAEHGFDHHVLHKDAWDALKETGCVEGLKKSILKKAIANRQNIVLPDCALKPERIKDMLKSLQDAGYEMHAICLWAPQEEAERRGRLRSVKTGKAYNPKFHQPSCEGTLEVIAHWENQMSLPNGGSFGSIEFYDAGSAPAIRVRRDHFEMLIRCAEKGRRRSLCRPEEGRRSSVSEKSKELALVNDAAWVKQAEQLRNLFTKFRHWACQKCPSFHRLSGRKQLVVRKALQGFIPAGLLGLVLLAATRDTAK